MSVSQPDALAPALLATIRRSFVSYHSLTERALAQLSPEEWLHCPAPGANSAAVIVQHLVGNLRSRFTDFWTSDGEKPDRHRDQEFEEPDSVEAVAHLQQQWQAAWPILWAVLDELAAHPERWLQTVTIRQEPHSVLDALERQVAHYAYHTGQIVQLAKHLRGEAWQTLSVPRGQSEQFNAAMRAKAAPTPDNPNAGSAV
ncbi:DUF1572 domain-containing protein [Hymenobacter busanensis]|uniref:DUF1572 domain-containing protein n=1 Tax=Hymenobacter busanensis TaxID=2607656 RepID=A0A7L5A2V6_9BACT|nr:DUF1572 family protein [Hymenobacter busanensis]KAA9327081.1 DUF1572 domain-containing protein [Hymenobacter busanensis]QHJ09533.1 DUF1572 domain-containing protein [Hymenobacter busanensis]